MMATSVNESAMEPACECQMARYCHRRQRFMMGHDIHVCRVAADVTPQIKERFERYWARTTHPEIIPPGPKRPKRPFRLGDRVARWIKIGTFGLLTQKSGCGCGHRQAKLNAFSDGLFRLFRRKPRISPERIAECQRLKAAQEASVAAAISAATDIA